MCTHCQGFAKTFLFVSGNDTQNDTNLSDTNLSEKNSYELNSIGPINTTCSTPVTHRTSGKTSLSYPELQMLVDSIN